MTSTTTQEANTGSKTMKAAFLEDYGKPIVVKDVPMPVPGSGEVLIKVEATPINPSDLEAIKGNLFKLESWPARLGFEGAGTVVSHGGGIIPRIFVGKRVAFGIEPGTKESGNQGTWSQYLVAPALRCIPIDESIPVEVAACTIVNPFTALAFQNIVKSDKHKGVVVQAAASQLGRMLVKLFKKDGVKTIGLVRKDEQVKMLEELGYDAVLNTKDENFEEKLKKKAEEFSATCHLESVGGELAGKVLKVLPKNSTCYIYGILDDVDFAKIDQKDLLKNNKSVKGFLSPNWMAEQNIFTLLSMVKNARSMIDKELKPEIAKTFQLHEINEALDCYKDNMTKGKIIIKPHSDRQDEN